MTIDLTHFDIDDGVFPTSDNIGQGFNARIAFLDRDGIHWVQKYYHYEGLDIPMEDVEAAYRAYRAEVAQVYRVPESYVLQVVDESTMVAEELRIEGVGVQLLIGAGRMNLIDAVAKHVFLPLASTIIPPIRLIDYYREDSPYPVRTPIDIKPDNFVLSADGDLVYIDFMPPRLRGSDGLVYPNSEVLDCRHPSRRTHLYGDLTTQIPRFLTRCFIDHLCLMPGRNKAIDAGEIAEIGRSLMLGIEPDGQLMQATLSNLQHPHVQQNSFFRHGQDHQILYDEMLRAFR